MREPDRQRLPKSSKSGSERPLSAQSAPRRAKIREKREVGQASGAPKAPEKKVAKVNLEERSESTENYNGF